MNNKLLMKIFVLLIVLNWSCSNLNENPNDIRIKNELDMITDNTTVVKISSCTREEYPLIEIIDSVRYISLENTDKALIAIIKTIKITNDLIYILDLQSHKIKCFDRSGTFLRDACQIGAGPQEISHLIDFDVDEDYLYILDGAKIAIHFFDHTGKYIKNEKLPYRAHKIHCLPDNCFYFELAPFGIQNNENSNLAVYTDSDFKPIDFLLKYVDGADCGVSFGNQRNSAYLFSSYGNGIYEKVDGKFVMKYYVDFNGKYFNTNKKDDGFKQAIEQNVYFTSSAPLHNNTYLLQSYTAGLKRDGTLLVNLKENKAMFIRRLIQDKNDLIDFSFSHTMGYDVVNNEFFGICNYIDLSTIISDKETAVESIKKYVNKEVQSALIHENEEKDVNQIIVFYKLKDEIVF